MNYFNITLPPIMKIKNESSVKDLMKNKNYSKYFEERERIRKKYHDKLLSAAKYPNQEKEWEKYKKDIMDLLLKPNGYYQKFVWDIIEDENEYLLSRQKSRKKL